jgi:DNA polymerase-1
VFIALRRTAAGIVATDLDEQLIERARVLLADDDLAGFVIRRESERPRWIWNDTATWYPPLLGAGARIERAVDLRLTHLILRRATTTTGTPFATAAASAWDAPAPARRARADTLFDLDAPPDDEDPVTEFVAQRGAVDAAATAARLTLLLAAESVGALAAAEMAFAGLPWNAVRHDELLTELLGPRPLAGRPVLLEAAATQLREALDAPDLNPDSQPDLLRALQNAGLPVSSTSRWELRDIDHPVVPPLLAYKKLSRLLVANGWHWLDEWVHDGRFRPVYVPGGVVSGRWATDGGGALQLPRQLRGAVVPDPGWRLVVADASQLEPRVLAAMSGDVAMARAGRAADMYQAMVDAGAVETRSQAKYGMLGAIYGGTTGESGRMLPRIERAFPTAMAYVEAAARAGEQGEAVSTWLGRGSPAGEHLVYDETASNADAAQSRRRARDHGRFTRNFVVQGTAAEWALCWIGALRRRLWELGDGALVSRPHLVFFLHDELIVHTPAGIADEVASAMRDAAAEAGRLLFGQTPVEFALSVAIADSYADAKE